MNKKAFSLIEISVVILIIVILIYGVSVGVDLYQDFRLATARSLTLNSRVGRIEDLSLWV
jgi:prepilin-type N-terminal cleavage/methylation domain-containing protein